MFYKSFNSHSTVYEIAVLAHTFFSARSFQFVSEVLKQEHRVA